MLEEHFIYVSDLLLTGERPIKGVPSTWQWEKWNGLIHLLIRDKLRQGIDLTSIKTLESLQDLEAVGCVET